MPEFLKFEVTIFVTVKARQTEALAQNVIFLEPAPDDWKIVEDFKPLNAKSLAASMLRKVNKVMDDLTLARGRSANQDQDIKLIFSHGSISQGRNWSTAND